MVSYTQAKEAIQLAQKVSPMIPELFGALALVWCHERHSPNFAQRVEEVCKAYGYDLAPIKPS